MSILHSLGGLQDSYATVTDIDPESPDAGITCDSPKNTWTAGKALDERARRHNGKRLDYILFRGPASSGPIRMQCVQHKVVFTEPILAYGVSFSDHFGVEATFQFKVEPHNAPIQHPPPAEVLGHTIPLLRDTLRNALERQQWSLRIFGGLLAAAAILTAGNVCGAVWLSHGRSVPSTLVTALLLIPTTWAGTTALYDGVIWGEWVKRRYKD